MSSRVPREVLRDVLLGAAEYIEQNGWTQGSSFDPVHATHSVSPSACAFGAIQKSTEKHHSMNVDSLYFESDVVNEACETVEDYLNLSKNNYYRQLSRWNDQNGRTANVVVAALRGAAVSLYLDEPNAGNFEQGVP